MGVKFRHMSHQGWSLLSALMEVKSIGQCRRNSKRLVWCSSSTLLDGAQIQLVHWWSSNLIGWSSFIGLFCGAQFWSVHSEWFILSDRGQLGLVNSEWSTPIGQLRLVNSDWSILIGRLWLVNSDWSTLVFLLAGKGSYVHGQNISQLLPLNLRESPSD